MSKHYKSLKEFQEATLTRLKPILKEPGLLIKVQNIIGGGDHEWATAELKADAECQNGMAVGSSLYFYNCVCATQIKY